MICGSVTIRAVGLIPCGPFHLHDLSRGRVSRVFLFAVDLRIISAGHRATSSDGARGRHGLTGEILAASEKMTGPVRGFTDN